MDRTKAVRWLLVVLIGFHFALNLQQSGKAYVHAEAYTHYAEKRPYQYRTLMAPVMGGLMASFGGERAQAVLHKLPVYVSTPEGATYVLINAASFAASVLLVLAIGRRLQPRRPLLLPAVYLAMSYLFICLNPNVAFILPYDIPALAFAQACILCVLDRRWRLLVPLFAIATVNRETVFMVGVFAALHMVLTPEMAERRFDLLLLLAAVWLAIKLALFLTFAHLPTDEGLRVGYNLRSLAKPWQWPALMPLVASVVLSVQALRTTPDARPWALTGLAGFALVFAVGQITETRAFADLMIFFSVAIALWIDRRTVRTSVVMGTS